MTAIDVAHVPLAVQLAHVRAAAVGVTPDGGASFVLAFMPRGGALASPRQHPRLRRHVQLPERGRGPLPLSHTLRTQPSERCAAT